MDLVLVDIEIFKCISLTLTPIQEAHPYIWGLLISWFMFSPDLELTKTCNAYSVAQSCPTLCKPLDGSLGSPGGARGKELPCQCRRGQFHPWVGKIPWRRKWQPTPVFFPGESHGKRSLVCCSQSVHKKSDMTEDACNGYEVVYHHGFNFFLKY